MQNVCATNICGNCAVYQCVTLKCCADWRKWNCPKWWQDIVDAFELCRVCCRAVLHWIQMRGMANRVSRIISVQGLSVLVFLFLHIHFSYCVSTSIPLIVPQQSAPPPSPSSVPTASPPLLSVIRESVVIPSSVDSEKEAKELYDKALKQYGSYGASARHICAVWELRGCQCSGAVEELALSCRDVGFEEVPLDLPAEIIKL